MSTSSENYLSKTFEIKTMIHVVNTGISLATMYKDEHCLPAKCCIFHLNEDLCYNFFIVFYFSFFPDNYCKVGLRRRNRFRFKIQLPPASELSRFCVSIAIECYNLHLKFLHLPRFTFYLLTEYFAYKCLTCSNIVIC